MRKNYILGALCIASALSFTACEKENMLVESTPTQLTLNGEPIAGLENVRYEHAEFVILDRNTQKEQTVTISTSGDNQFQLELAAGFYDLTFRGTITYEIAGETIEGTVKGFLEGVQVTGNTLSLPLQLFLYSESADFVFEEIFYTGTLKTDGKAYIGDAYFKIYNNSDEVLYADGLGIAESAFTTSNKYDYTPSIMGEAMTIQSLYVVPGNGTQYPIQPGGSLIICDKAINHIEEANPNSFDLSGADFEWYDESTNSTVDTDNPLVPNLEKVYSYTKSIWVPAKQGNRAYALVRLGTDTQDYLTNYTYSYSYQITGAANTMTKESYKIPNAWILDAVNIGTPSNFQWLVTDPSLDMGWMGCGQSSNDADRYGKSIRRKQLSTSENGRIILQDTNNSTNDFAVEQVPSLQK